MNTTLQGVLGDLFASNELNRLPEQYGGARIFARLLIGVARGDDPIFAAFKSVVGPEHLTPVEMWVQSGLPDSEGLAGRLRVSSVVFPYASRIREAGAANQGHMPPEIYCVARNFADSFIRAALDTATRFFQECGYRATSPMSSSAYQLLSKDESGSVYANWSERHVAFAAGLGTFSLQEALITPVGCNTRMGSVITDAPLTVSPRTSDEPRANCLYFAAGACGACIARCPAGAITKDGHDKRKCRLYGQRVREDMLGRALRSILKPKHLRIDNQDRITCSVGCGLCQFGVPCTDRNPTATLQKGRHA